MWGMWGPQKLTVAELEEKLLTGTSSPQTQATKPDYVKFHDDKVCLGSRASRACAVCMQIPSGLSLELHGWLHTELCYSQDLVSG